MTCFVAYSETKGYVLFFLSQSCPSSCLPSGDHNSTGPIVQQDMCSRQIQIILRNFTSVILWGGSRNTVDQSTTFQYTCPYFLQSSSHTLGSTPSRLAEIAPFKNLHSRICHMKWHSIHWIADPHARMFHTGYFMVSAHVPQYWWSSLLFHTVIP